MGYIRCRRESVGFMKIAHGLALFALLMLMGCNKLVRDNLLDNKGANTDTGVIGIKPDAHRAALLVSGPCLSIRYQLYSGSVSRHKH